MGRLDEAAARHRKAIELDPKSAAFYLGPAGYCECVLALQSKLSHLSEAECNASNTATAPNI